MTVQSINTASITSASWNGGVCPTCAARYLGSHACSADDLTRRINELLALLARVNAPNVHSIAVPVDRTASCPCRPENGGSGVCGCTLGAPQITC